MSDHQIINFSAAPTGWRIFFIALSEEPEEGPVRTHVDIMPGWAVTSDGLILPTQISVEGDGCPEVLSEQWCHEVEVLSPGQTLPSEAQALKVIERRLDRFAYSALQEAGLPGLYNLPAEVQSDVKGLVRDSARRQEDIEDALAWLLSTVRRALGA